ncbi:hypothetical protein CL654_01960 [bacterium]|nr:hypothetical protein [bacterium]|tara:strand:+ start:25894 stop:26349 length:456 start_codon:yes stop_codon:yes gene_type:complete
MNKLTLSIVLLVIVSTGVAVVVWGNNKSNQIQVEKPVQNNVYIEELVSQTNEDGAVSVTVTPLDETLSSFDVVLNTHSMDINEDMVEVSIMVDEKGNEYKPVGWEGDPAGGHHREGILSFKEIEPEAKSITLFIRNVGGVEERKFEWKTSL